MKKFLLSILFVVLTIVSPVLLPISAIGLLAMIIWSIVANDYQKFCKPCMLLFPLFFIGIAFWGIETLFAETDYFKTAEYHTFLINLCLIFVALAITAITYYKKDIRLIASAWCSYVIFYIFVLYFV